MLVISIIVSIILIALAIFIVLASKSRINSKEGGPDNMKQIYVYFVLFATLMMTIGGSVSVFMALADIVSPAPYHQSFEDYRQWSADYDASKEEKKSEEDLRKSYEEMVKSDAEQAKARAINTLIKSFGWIVIPFPIFLYFQRRIPKKE